MTQIDTSTEAVTALFEALLDKADDHRLFVNSEVGVTGTKVQLDRITAARTLVPALLAERDDLRAKLAEVQAEKEKLGREVNIARYGQPDFSWQIHREALAEARARAAAAFEMAVDAVEDYCADMPDLAGHGHSVGLRDAILARADEIEKGETE